MPSTSQNKPSVKPCTASQGKSKALRKPRGKQFRWANTTAQQLLLQWLEEPGNYEKWRCAGTAKESGGKKTCKDTKTAVLRDLLAYFTANGVTTLTEEAVKGQLKKLEDTYKAARKLFGTTGEGITEEDIAKNISTIKDKVEHECPLYDRLHPIFRDCPKMVAPYAADTMDAEQDVEEFLLGTSASKDSTKKEADRETGNSDCEASDLEETATPSSDEVYQKLKDTLSDNDVEVLPLLKRVKTTPSSSASQPHSFKPSYLKKNTFDDAMKEYEEKKLEVEKEKLEVSRRKVDIMEKTSDYSHQEKMEALSIQRMEAEARKMEAESNRLLLQIQLAKLDQNNT